MQMAGHHGWVGVYQHICAACGGPPRFASTCWPHPVAPASGWPPHPSLLHLSPHCIAHFISPGCLLGPYSFSLAMYTATTMSVKSSTDRYGSCRCRLGELPNLPALWLTCRARTNTEAYIHLACALHIEQHPLLLASEAEDQSRIVTGLSKQRQSVSNTRM